MSFQLCGLGISGTPYPLSQEKASSLAQAINNRRPDTDGWIQDIYRHAGIQKRTICVSEAVVRDIEQGTRETGSPFLLKGPEDFHGPSTAQRMKVYWEIAAPMSLAAAKEALSDARVEPEEITHLVLVTCTGFRSPGLDCWLIEQLKLNSDVARTQVGFMGCQGAFNGLRVAKAFTGSDPKAVVLMVAVEVCSVHYHYGREMRRLVGNALFADGAAALVGRSPAAGIGSNWELKTTGSCMLPDSEDAMSWSIGDYGFEMELSPKIPNMIAKYLTGWLESWLKSQHLNQADIRSWAIHPGGPKILNGICEVLGLGEDEIAVSREVLSQYGNMSSATVLFLLRLHRLRNAPRPCLALGFGPGMFVESMLWV
ncbi:type III polyketide synthase [Telmatocola sphagniphila]|uniref:Type III polyketide synthase n=1 Tax=Telmatocola sphagniphila TaxID=1123043 RepID=A0A8E6EX75_9BACT|nr:type III polyketide synthase [Telmatocola sphagniphila]QVL34582.1 type III polyketide synthase [Telmatocola sphagniphila]